MASANGKAKSTKKSRLIKKPEKDKWKVNKWISRGFSLMIFLIGSSLIRFYFTEPPIIRVSSVIRQHVNVAFTMMQNELELKTFLADDPLLELMKDGLRPIQDRLTSLRTQTSQYEKMEHIPGGPKSFIASSLQELEIHSRKIAVLSQQALEQIKLYGVQQKVLSRGGKEMITETKKLHDGVTIMVLNNLTFFGQPNYSKEVELELEEMATKVTFEEVLKSLLDLALEYEKMEELAIQATKMVQKTVGVDDLLDLLLLKDAEMTDEQFEIILPIVQELDTQRRKVEHEKSKIEKHLLLFSFLRTRVMDSFMRFSDQLKDYETEKRMVYFRLHDMIISDIKQLKVRVQNLQYKYAKRSVDL